MKDKTLIVKKKNVWGNELIYPVCQVVVLNSFHVVPCPSLLVEGSPPERLLFFLIVLYPYYSFLCYVLQGKFG